MSEDDIKSIAGGLTKAQKKAVVGAVWNIQRGEWRAFAMFPADRNLRVGAGAEYLLRGIRGRKFTSTRCTVPFRAK